MEQHALAASTPGTVARTCPLLWKQSALVAVQVGGDGDAPAALLSVIPISTACSVVISTQDMDKIIASVTTELD